ncbi:MAG: FMN-binding protein [Clostridiales bacterium]|nr:FMN-binding protein [Clostridiales bacterium]
MKKQLPAWAALCIIALIAGLLLGITNEATAEKIAGQTALKADEARQSVLPGATLFEPLQLEEGANVKECYAGMNGETLVGYTALTTVTGYGGEIDVVTGLNTDGVITGINVGGAGFAETPGLGAKTRDAAFTGRFLNIAPADMGAIDNVTGATISSGAVKSGVSRGADYILGLISPKEETDGEDGDANLIEQPPADGIDAWWKSDQGRVVQVSTLGFGGTITVTVAIDNDGVITNLEISAPNETPGLGALVTESRFIDTFIGVSDASAVDTIAGATISSGAVKDAVHTALEFQG